MSDDEVTEQCRLEVLRTRAAAMKLAADFCDGRVGSGEFLAAQRRHRRRVRLLRGVVRERHRGPGNPAPVAWGGHDMG